MSKLEKLIERILEGRDVSYKEAERLLRKLGFSMDSRGSHHIFRKVGYVRHISLKQRPQLLPYQLRELKEVLREHDF